MVVRQHMCGVPVWTWTVRIWISVSHWTGWRKIDMSNLWNPGVLVCIWSVSSCDDCETGMYSMSDRRCYFWDSGKFSGEKGTTSETTCVTNGAGNYINNSNKTGTTEYVSCDTGKFSGVKGSTTVTTCVHYGKDKYSNKTGAIWVWSEEEVRWKLEMDSFQCRDRCPRFRCRFHDTLVHLFWVSLVVVCFIATQKSVWSNLIDHTT